MPDASIDLQSLARLPHGQAEKELRNAGLWDEHATGGEPRPFTVKVWALVQKSTSLEVMARTEEEAIEKAEKDAEGQFDGHWDIEWTSVEESEVVTP